MNENILMPINKCPSLINTAFETLINSEQLLNYKIESYMADNKKRQRTVIYNDKGVALSACYYELNTGLVIYGYTAEEHRRKGIYRQLKAYIHLNYKIKLWSQFQSNDYMQAFNKQ